MSGHRLYSSPDVTESVLRYVVKGKDTRKELAEELNCSKKTIYNKIHDPRILGFLEKKDDHYVISDKDELMGFFQLNKRDVLKKRFNDLPGVSEVDDKLNGGSMSFIDVGRLIAYYTDSEAIDEDAFKTYGRVYANWFDYLGMGDASNSTLYRNIPPNIKKKGKSEQNLSSPKVKPEKVFEALQIIDGGLVGRVEIASHFGFSERQAGKLLSTCYGLGLAERDQKIKLTHFGKRVNQAGEEERKRLIRESLLDIELIKTYCELSPDGPFKNQELMAKVGEALDKDWNETTIQTKAKRVYQWLIYSGLFIEVKRGTLVPGSELNTENFETLKAYI
jgi:hypothetical protein